MKFYLLLLYKYSIYFESHVSFGSERRLARHPENVPSSGMSHLRNNVSRMHE